MQVTAENIISMSGRHEFHIKFLIKKTLIYPWTPGSTFTEGPKIKSVQACYKSFIYLKT